MHYSGGGGGGGGGGADWCVVECVHNHAKLGGSRVGLGGNAWPCSIIVIAYMPQQLMSILSQYGNKYYSTNLKALMTAIYIAIAITL